MVQLHPGGFDIIIYNCLLDLLLLKGFCWKAKSIGVLWIVLHYGIFPIQDFNEEWKQYPCGYRTLVQMHGVLPEKQAWFGVNKADLIVDHPNIIERDYTCGVGF